jgi:hypothetical protein
LSKSVMPSIWQLDLCIPIEEVRICDLGIY